MHLLYTHGDSIVFSEEMRQKLHVNLAWLKFPAGWKAVITFMHPHKPPTQILSDRRGAGVHSNNMWLL